MANYQLEQTGAEVQALLNAVESPDTTPAAGSSNLITSGAVQAAVAGVSAEVTALGHKVGEIANNISEDDVIEKIPTAISGLKITSVIVTDANCTLYYVPVSVGDYMRVKTVTTSDYVRYGYTENIPAVYASVTDYTAEGSGTIEKEFVSPIDGYLCVSILTSSLVSIVFSTPNNGIGPKVKNIPEIENKTLGILYEDSLATRTADRYVKYNDGTIAVAGAGSKMEIYEFELEGDEICVDVVAGSADTIPAIIAFYKNGVYLKNESVQALALAENRYIAPVPQNATKVIVSNRYGLVPNTKVYVGRMPRLKGKSSGGGVFVPSVSVINVKPFSYHFSPVSLIGGEIGPESIDDISIASRLGFPYIEANVHQTQDGEFVCLHGVNGKFGALFGSTYENTDINSVTLAFIKSNIRYNSPATKYQTSVPTLAEFCATCKMLGIGLQLKATDPSYFDDAYQLAKSIMGDNMILDTPPISARESFNGTIVYWFNSASNTFEDIVQQAKNYGSPFVASIGPTVISALKSSGRLSEFFEMMHSLGFMVGCAGVYQTESELAELISLGVDFVGSGHQVNPFCADIIYDINGDASQFSGTGSIVNGESDLAIGETIIAGDSGSIALGKGEVLVKFNGELTFAFGSAGSRTFTSDGTEYIVISDYFFQDDTELVITAVAATKITELAYMIKVC